MPAARAWPFTTCSSLWTAARSHCGLATPLRDPANYAGKAGHTYAFYSVAIDNVGHVEQPPAMPDAVTSVVSTITVSLTSDHAAGSIYGQDVTFVAAVSSAGAEAPTGFVQFVAGRQQHRQPREPDERHGQLHYQQSWPGSHTLIAVYQSNSPDFNNSQSEPLNQNVSKAPLTVTAANASKEYGAPILCSASRLPGSC